MSSMPLLYLLMGFLFAKTLLAVGMALGFWFAKRSPSVVPNSPQNSQQNNNKCFLWSRHGQLDQRLRW